MSPPSVRAGRMSVETGEATQAMPWCPCDLQAQLPCVPATVSVGQFERVAEVERGCTRRARPSTQVQAASSLPGERPT